MVDHEVVDASYINLIRKMELKPLTYHDVANDWEKNGNEWYHAMIAIEDLPIVLAIPNLNIYAWCRCKVVADMAPKVILQKLNVKAGERKLIVLVSNLRLQRIHSRRLFALTMLSGFSVTLRVVMDKE